MAEHKVAGPGENPRENGADRVDALPCLTAYLYRVIQQILQKQAGIHTSLEP